MESTPAIPATAPEAVWSPLPENEWNADAARHLLRRTGWSAQPPEVERAVKEGLATTLARLFPPEASLLPKPKLISNLQEDTQDFLLRVNKAPPEEKRQLQQEARARSQQAIQDLSIKWLQFAAEPAHSATEKWVLFLSDVYVVGADKVQRGNLIYDHYDILRRYGLSSGPVLTKAVSRSPAMVRYLDLQQSQRKAPNENFARELFELFVLGEGNYTEKDIKEAARAFTGYREVFGEYKFQKPAFDDTEKTVFGKTGKFTGDEVIDLAYTLPAASTFLPKEMVRFYLTEQPLPKEQLAALGQWWAGQKFDLRALTHRFFGSQLFFQPAYRGSYIKSPIQFYLGLVQDLELDVAPLARQVLGSLRQMGQTLFTPPNVRGWVGGRLWINSATLSARRQLVQTLFTAINEDNLNADDQVELVAARAEGHSQFTVETDQLKQYVDLPPEQVAERFVSTFLPIKVDQGYREALQKFLAGATTPPQRLDRVRNVAITLLQSPEYQLC
jgi:uncharacterized protein (DUF1800 family)